MSHPYNQLSKEQFKQLDPDKVYWIELRRLTDPDPSLVYEGASRFHIQNGILITPLAHDWATCDVTRDVSPTYTDYKPDGGYCLVVEDYEMVIFDPGNLAVKDGVCEACGREYDDITHGHCPSDDCPSNYEEYAAYHLDSFTRTAA